MPAASPEWADDAIAKLRVLWAEGHSTPEIGRRLGVTKDAVIGKARRLKLAPRQSPIIRTGGPSRESLRQAEAQAKRDQDAAAARRKAEVEAADARAGRAMIRPAGVGECSFPIGEPRTPGFRYCDAPTVNRRTYCDEHHALCWRVVPVRFGRGADA